MSPNQKFNFFMPAWNKCVHANGWHTRDHAAVVDTGRFSIDEQFQVVSIAQKLAGKECRRLTLRDLRHACTVLCLGRDKDTDKLNNDEQDHIVWLFRVLANPLDLNARQKYEACKAGKNPGKQVRRQHFIKSRAPEAMLRHLTHDLTGGQTKDWESLDPAKEAELARLLAQRPVYGHSPVQSPKPKGQGPKNYVLNPHKTFQPKPTQQAELNPDWTVKGAF